ncbi:MAG TPA: hypothetical protein VM032_11130 [Vicinamibacterales bacterium]|nr:hypothetical protein [Vicinamibacterales bacterium]
MTDLIARVRSFNLPAVAFAVSTAVLGHALQISSGTYDVDALWWVGVALGLCLLATLTHRSVTSWSRTGVQATTIVLLGGVFWNIQQQVTAKPGVYIPPTTSLTPFYAGCVLIGGLVLLGVAVPRLVRRVWFPLILATGLLLGIWMIRSSPNPAIDVVVVHNEAMNAFLEGKDPYRISFPNIYGDDWKYYYNPAVVFGDRIGFGYPYPPPSLILAIPGYLAFGDYRYSELAFLIAACVLIGYSRRHRAAPLAAVMLLTTPRGYFVLEQGWTEPISIFLVALTTFLLMEGPVRASWAAGLMLATKQYLPFTGLSVLRSLWLDPPHWKKALAWIVVTGAICILPFALWHTNSFMRAVVWLQTLEPFRTDSLSFLIWADRSGYGRGSFLFAIGAAVCAAVLSLFTTRNSPSGFATSTAITMFAMFAMGSKAFCNYYYFVIGAMCIAVAAFAGPGEDELIVR